MTASLVALVGCTDDTTDGVAVTSAPGAAPGEDPAGGAGSAPSSTAASPDRGPEELGPLASVDVDVETGDGRVQLGDAEVPDLVPSSFPVPDDLVVQLATETGDAAGFSGVTAMPLDELVAFYLDEFAAGGWSAETRPIDVDAVAVISFTGDAGSGEVALSQAPGGGRSVIVTFQQ